MMKMIRNLLSKLLKLEGYVTFQSEIGNKGLFLLKNEEIAVVISDVKLPGINDIDLICKIKEINPLCEIIVLTAYGIIEEMLNKNSLPHEFLQNPQKENTVSLKLEEIEKNHIISV